MEFFCLLYYYYFMVYFMRFKWNEGQAVCVIFGENIIKTIIINHILMISQYFITEHLQFAFFYIN